MIKFKALIQAIHQSIHSAAAAVEAEGIKHIESFFDPVEPDPDSGSTPADAATTPVTHRPKMVALEFPSRTQDGSETIIAHIPLIALSPISSPRIKEVKFTTELEVATSEESDELFVSFPPPNRTGIFGRGGGESRCNTRIEITLSGHEAPSGLQQLIEGYERALRSQIPG
ncbi:MAG: DUF2589 domain-containing protein [Gammaproteobacteria bacterium]